MHSAEYRTFTRFRRKLASYQIPGGFTRYYYTDELEEETGELTNEQQVINWVTDYLTIAKSHGIPCVWWDNNSYISNGEQFGLLDRDTCEWFTEDVLNAIMAVYEDSGDTTDTSDSVEVADSEDSSEA